MPDEQIKKAVEAAPDALEDSAVREAMLVELAALSPVEYDQRREKARKRLGVRVATLDAEVAKRRPVVESDTDTTDLFSDPEPWPDPVDGAALLDALAASFTRYVVLPDGAANALALWVVFAHAHDAAQVSPIMAVVSPEKRCGKTTCLTILQALAPRALPTANITAAALFRTVEKWGRRCLSTKRTPSFGTTTSCAASSTRATPARRLSLCEPSATITSPAISVLGRPRPSPSSALCPTPWPTALFTFVCAASGPTKSLSGCAWTAWTV